MHALCLFLSIVAKDINQKLRAQKFREAKETSFGAEVVS